MTALLLDILRLTIERIPTPRTMKPEHLKIEAGWHTPNPGGQQVGMPGTIVKATHIPTGLVAQCDCERSQMRNKNICLAMLEYGLAELGWKEQ